MVSPPSDEKSISFPGHSLCDCINPVCTVCEGPHTACVTSYSYCQSLAGFTTKQIGARNMPAINMQILLGKPLQKMGWSLDIGST